MLIERPPAGIDYPKTLEEVANSGTSKERIVNNKYAFKCHYDQILDIHFFTFSYTIDLS